MSKYVGVPRRKNAVRSLAPLTLHGHVTRFLWDFDVTFGHSREIMGNLRDDDHLK